MSIGFVRVPRNPILVTGSHGASAGIGQLARSRNADAESASGAPVDRPTAIPGHGGLRSRRRAARAPSDRRRRSPHEGRGRSAQGTVSRLVQCLSAPLGAADDAAPRWPAPETRPRRPVAKSGRLGPGRRRVGGADTARRADSVRHPFETPADSHAPARPRHSVERPPRRCTGPATRIRPSRELRPAAGRTRV